jgi:tetratricopeptide (TPR) repeat protein
MDYFRKAIEREPGYGSAIINLARSMVLLPTYDDSPDAGDCWYDSRISDQSDCYEAALKLLDLYIVNAPYIQNYIYGIKGYIYTQQGQWRLAAAQFDRAKNETPSDPDMWQWMSQFLASVGELDGALEGIETAFRLNPNSGVILDRYGVVLMWLGMYDEAAIRFNEAAEYPHVPFEASELVWRIRGQQWDEVRQLLARHAGSRRDGAAWIDDFLAGLGDSGQRAAAVAAVETAIQANELSGQYVYGAWALLGEPERAIDAALRLLEDDPDAIAVEFLFAPETKAMRQRERFGLVVQSLGLDDYWSAGGANCPSLFERVDERNWCS